VGKLKIAFPYLLVLAMTAGVYWSNVRGRRTPKPGAADAHAAGADPQRLIDPVCKMQVNKGWGFTFEQDGTTTYFCSAHCRDEFAADASAYVGRRCTVCDALMPAKAGLPATYLGKTYYLCSEEHRAAFKADPAGFFMHRMWGIPDWLYYVSIAAVLLVSFLMFEGVPIVRRKARADAPSSDASRESAPIRAATVRERSAEKRREDASILFTRSAPPPALAYGPATAAAISLPVVQAAAPAWQRSDRIDLLRIPIVSVLFRSRVFRFTVQAVMAFFFLLILAAGLFGNQNPGLNIAPLLTWTIWWAGLVVLIMFAGKAWCFMCPWDAIAGWAERLTFWKKTDDGVGLNLRWPRVVRNIWIATILFVGLTWVEIGFGVTMRPAATAYLGIGMLLMALVSAFLFDRKSFCRYGCLVGRVSGLYALFAGVEIRRRDPEVCRTCRSKECVKGSDSAYGCPTYEYPGGMQTNTYCIQCTECLQACSKDNLAVNLRPWGEDLRAVDRPRRDEAYLALLMLALAGFHGLTMTPVWRKMTDAIGAWLPLGEIFSFTVGMVALLAIPILVYAGLVWVSYRLTTARARAARPGRRVTYFDYFIRYAYCVLPIALFYHLAHNLEHLLMEGQKVIALISDPFGWGWNLFGTARWVVPPLVSLDVLWILQVALVGVGHVYSLWAAGKITRRMFSDRSAARLGQWPMLIGMIAFSIFSLWLLKQPMEMRTSAM